MTKKEELPKKKEEENEETRNALPFDPDITPEDKEVLNNQSQDERPGDYFKDRNEPIDYAGADLDIPEMDEGKFNDTANEPDEIEKAEKPKESANSNDDLDAQSDTIYKGEKAKKYKDPSEKTRHKK